MNSSRAVPTKLDLKKTLRPLYSGSPDTVRTVTAGTRHFLCSHGTGDPNTSAEYKAAVEALFSVSYGLKFSAGKRLGRDYVVMPLEGLWWSDDMSVFQCEDRARWHWTMMIMQPEFITMEDVARAQEVAAKRGVAANKVSLEQYTEGSSAQILHVGPFTAEGPTIQRVHEWIAANGYSLAGKHHEIYLTDIRRVPANKWKTLIRQPYT